MFASPLGQDLRVRSAQLQVCACRTIPITKHVEYRNATTEVLRRRGRIEAGHVQHSVKSMGFAGKTEVSSRIGGFSADDLEFSFTFIKTARQQVRFGCD